MAISPFVFSSANLPSRKAKQLFKAFPFLKLSVAQEATARALGYSSWYECTKRGTVGDQSLSDQQAGLSVRVPRYYHQAGTLMDLGITPIEADLWVRAWGLTGQPTLAPREGVPMYYRWAEAIERFERGEIVEAQLIDEWGDDNSKYPEIDRPERVCPGVILGPMGRYPHYAVDPALNARIPIQLRGPSCLYHLEDGVDVLQMCVQGFPSPPPPAEPILERMNAVQYEWHHGQKHPRASELSLPKLEAAATAKPDAMVVISVRAMPTPDGGFDFGRHAVACLRGKDFAAFLRAKGGLDTSKVIWYQDVRFQCTENWWAWLHSVDRWDGGLPLFTEAHHHQPSLPLYSYPFMAAPMANEEYSGTEERSCLLPLDADYEDDDDGGGEDAAPDSPDPDLDSIALTHLRESAQHALETHG